jgi:6-phosphogluconolactonase (cycloisomerase 2 family)
MKAKCLLLVLSAIIAILLAGCGGVSSTSSAQPAATPTPTPIPAPSPTPSATPTPTPTATSSFIYGIEAFESEDGYEAGQINSTNGQVTPVLPPFNNSGLGQNIVIQLISDPQGRFLYGLNIGASGAGQVIGQPGISEMQINRPGGALSLIPGSPVVFPVANFGILAIDSTGHFLFQPDANTFDIYSIDQTTGLLTKTTAPTAGVAIGPFTAMSPDGRFLFDASDTAVETLSVDANGNLALVQTPVTTGGSAMGAVGQLTVSADNRFLYVLNQGSISIFGIGANGTLTPVIGSPFATDQGGMGFALTPTGNRLYLVANPNGTSVVEGFTFDPTASTLTPITEAVIGDKATTVTVDGSGRFAYITENGQLSTFAIDPATGNLTVVAQTSQPTSENPQSMVVVP